MESCTGNELYRSAPDLYQGRFTFTAFVLLPLSPYILQCGHQADTTRFSYYYPLPKNVQVTKEFFQIKKISSRVIDICPKLCV